MKKSLAQLKREAKEGKLSLEMVYRYNEEIPEKLKGIRKVIGAKTNSIQLMNNDGNISYLDLDCSSLVDYVDNSLIIYNYADRELTEEEKREMEKAEADLEEEKKTNPWWLDSVYWWEKDWYKNSQFPWLLGTEFVKGKKLHYVKDNKPMIWDKSIKGEKIIEYKVYYEK